MSAIPRHYLIEVIDTDTTGEDQLFIDPFHGFALKDFSAGDLARFFVDLERLLNFDGAPGSILDDLLNTMVTTDSGRKHCAPIATFTFAVHVTND